MLMDSNAFLIQQTASSNLKKAIVQVSDACPAYPILSGDPDLTPSFANETAETPCKEDSIPFCFLFSIINTSCAFRVPDPTFPAKLRG
jgi:hypothetical protein